MLNGDRMKAFELGQEQAQAMLGMQKSCSRPASK
jgi:hypothetical protein